MAEHGGSRGSVKPALGPVAMGKVRHQGVVTSRRSTPPGGWLPNTRVQRTRSAPRRSPLTRKPLGNGKEQLAT